VLIYLKKCNRKKKNKKKKTGSERRDLLEADQREVKWVESNICFNVVALSGVDLILKCLLP